MPRRAGDAGGGLRKRGPVIAQYRHIYFRVEYFDQLLLLQRSGYLGRNLYQREKALHVINTSVVRLLLMEINLFDFSC